MEQWLNGPMAYPLFTTRKIVHMSMLVFAFLLPFLTWLQAAGCALLALLYNLFILPRMGMDLGKRPRIVPGFGRAQIGPGGPAALESSTTSKEVVEAEANIWGGIILYPVSVLLLILLYRHSMQVVAAVWAIMALGDGMASVVGEALGGPGLPYNRQKTWSGFVGFVVAGTAGAYALTRWVSPELPVDQVLAVCTLTAAVGALVESVPIRLADNLTVPLVCGVFMFCAYLAERSALESNLRFLERRAGLAIAVNMVFALLALGLKWIDRSGAVAGFLLGTAVYLGRGYKSFLVLLAFFLLGSLATRLGYAKKAARGAAEARGGARSWREALANGMAAGFFSILAITTRHEGAFLLALVAAFAQAAGDTVSSEIGQWLSDRAYLITTFRPVPAGENGAISLAGTTAGLAASAAIVVLGYGLGLCGKDGAAVALGVAFAGNLLDSILGATIERRGLVSNAVVNFAGTSFAGALALAWALRAGL